MDSSSSSTTYLELLEKYSQSALDCNSFVDRDYSSLVEFLKRTKSRPEQLLSRQESPTNEFGIIYELDGRSPVQGIPLRRFLAKYSINSPRSNQLLFLSGYPCSKTLGELGGYFAIDPEFFDRHLNFLRNSPHVEDKILPSMQGNIIQMVAVSIGAQDKTSESLSSKRQSYQQKMETYLHNLTMGRGWKPCDSIVRRFDVHDARNVSVEQLITILIAKNKAAPDKWIVIVWQDAGADLVKSPTGPWLDSQHAPYNMYFRPIVLHDHDRIFGPRWSDRSQINSSVATARPGQDCLLQTISQIAKSYGQTLSASDMSGDPLYALTEVFRFTATSEAMFLDMVTHILNRYDDDTLYGLTSQQATARATLAGLQRTLERHSGRVTSLLEFLNHYETIKLSATALTAISLISRDFECIQQNLRDQISRCSQELNIMISEINGQEARRGIEQTRRSHKFVVLAAVYVPLSFSCSVFGMNFVQVSDVMDGVRIWMAITIPLFIFSLFFVSWDAEAISRKFQKLLPQYVH